MPIDVESFEAGNEPTGQQKSQTKPKVIEFLSENSETAYMNKEIADSLELVPATVSHTVRKLVEDGLVDYDPSPEYPSSEPL